MTAPYVRSSLEGIDLDDTADDARRDARAQAAANADAAAVAASYGAESAGHQPFISGVVASPNAQRIVVVGRNLARIGHATIELVPVAIDVPTYGSVEVSTPEAADGTHLLSLSEADGTQSTPSTSCSPRRGQTGRRRRREVQPAAGERRA